MVVAYCEAIRQIFHRRDLRGIHALYIHVHGQADVAVPQNRLYILVGYPQGVKIGCESPPESVPAVPQGKGTIPVENVSIGQVVGFLLLANRARRKSGNYDAASDIVEVQRLAVASLKDWQIGLRQDSRAQTVRL